jgi:hypothetical protein
MPVILAPGDYAHRLGEEPDPRDVMRPFPAELMRMWPISTWGNKPENDHTLDSRIGRAGSLRNRSDGQSFICLGAELFEEEPRHELRHDAGCCACRVLV